MHTSGSTLIFPYATFAADSKLASTEKLLHRDIILILRSKPTIPFSLGLWLTLIETLVSSLQEKLSSPRFGDDLGFRIDLFKLETIFSLSTSDNWNWQGNAGEFPKSA